MSESCNHNCESCGQSCSERTQAPAFDKAMPNEHSHIKKVIGVVSGKGGVGKSMVTSLLAVTMNRREYRVGILDADVTGPSIPKAFGVKEKVYGSEFGMIPGKSKMGIDIMSVNLLLENETDPVVWRGPIIAGTVKQFFSEVLWKDIDFLFLDMPPGTGDVPLTVFQSIPLDGIVIVTSPQELVSMVVLKAVNMAKMMNVPVLGIIENMSYFVCPNCKQEHKIFGESHVEAVAAQQQTKVLGKIPMDPAIAKLADSGLIELYEGDYLERACDEIEKTF